MGCSSSGSPHSLTNGSEMNSLGDLRAAKLNRVQNVKLIIMTQLL